MAVGSAGRQEASGRQLEIAAIWGDCFPRASLMPTTIFNSAEAFTVPGSMFHAGADLHAVRMWQRQRPSAMAGEFAGNRPLLVGLF